MNYLLLVIIILILFAFLLKYLNENKGHFNKSKHTSKSHSDGEFIENDKQILIENTNYIQVKEAILDFKNNYIDKQHPQSKLLFRLYVVDLTRILITFPYNINFETLCLFIKYLQNSEILDSKAKTLVWATTQESDNWLYKEIGSQEIMLFMEMKNKGKKSLTLLTSEGQNYSLDLGTNFNMQKTDQISKKYRHPEFTEFELTQLVEKDML